jgi:hypothetical protein
MFILTNIKQNAIPKLKPTNRWQLYNSIKCLNKKEPFKKIIWSKIEGMLCQITKYTNPQIKLEALKMIANNSKENF